MATLKVEIVSPEAALWTGDATSLTARSSDGDFTILPQHTSTVGAGNSLMKSDIFSFRTRAF